VAATFLLVAGCAGAIFGLSLSPLIWIAVLNDPGDQEGVAERAREMPFVKEVWYGADWLDGSWIQIVLSSGATDVDAKRVWCEAVLPHGVREETVAIGDGRRLSWGPPDDCTDPSDVPPPDAW
jgi:hypothetical protein